MPIQSQIEMRCPTCGARQEWADTCRRCKCDLRLLRAAEQTYERSRQLCLHHLHAGRPDTALPAAINCHSLRPGPETYRLLALCHLLEENWPEALEGGRRAQEARAGRERS
jgi:hypothetical protein